MLLLVVLTRELQFECAKLNIGREVSRNGAFQDTVLDSEYISWASANSILLQKKMAFGTFQDGDVCERLGTKFA